MITSTFLSDYFMQNQLFDGTHRFKRCRNQYCAAFDELVKKPTFMLCIDAIMERRKANAIIRAIGYRLQVNKKVAKITCPESMVVDSGEPFSNLLRNKLVFDIEPVP